MTPRSTAAVEAAGRRAFGTASAVVTVARMVGMAVGLAILTAYGSTTIDRLYDEVYATPDAYQQFIPEALRDRPLRDPLVVGALEAWASREAASIMVGLFVVAAGVTAVAIPPSLALGGGAERTRMLDGACGRSGATEPSMTDRRRTRRRWPRPARTRPRPLTRSPTSRWRARPAAGRHGTRRAAGDDPGRRAQGRTSSTSSKARTRWRSSRTWSGKPDARPGSTSSPRRRPGPQVGEALGLHPLIIEDVLEGNQRAKIETTNGIVHIVLFHLSYGESVVASELDIVLGQGVPADRPQRRLGPAGGAPPGRRHRSRSSSTGPTTCCGRSRTT